jgi:proteasome lid subunit RPN8/RPN11
LVPPVARLLVPIDHWQTMLDHVLACMPEEACGIVAGRQGIVAQVRPIENAAHSPFRFRMEPRGQVEALLDLEARGLELLAIYHSHPSGPPGPSATDVAELTYPEAAAMIWCSEGGQWWARAFDLSGPGPVETEIEILPANLADPREAL